MKMKAEAPSGSMPKDKERALELLVFLFLIVPSMVLSFFTIQQGMVNFTLTAIATILRDLALVSLILFFIWRNREALGSIGWRAQGALKEVGLGLLLFVPLYFGAGWLDQLLRSIGFSAPSTPLPAVPVNQGFGEILLAIVLVIVVALAEETIFRGYLLLRFENLIQSPVWAVILSAVVFSLGHGYEGTSGAVTVGAIGAAFAVVYLWRKSLIAPVVMHFLLDFLGIVLVPLLTGG
jgi:membrane protease YdiL (CAAX protease family)